MVCFNGATALLPWNPGEDWIQYAMLKDLQWGHGIAAVESQETVGQGPQASDLQWGHGIAAVESSKIMQHK